MNFAGKSAIVTGACSGIGLEAAKELLNRGVQNLGIFDVKPPGPDVTQLIKKYKGRNIDYYKTDTSCRENVNKSFKLFFEQHKRLDIVIGNAGILNENEYELMVNINLLGTIHTTYAAIDYMSKQHGRNGGVIANVSSVCGLEFLIGGSVYNATKHAILAFTNTFANEFYFKIHGINFTTICPAVTSTALMSDLNKIFKTPEEVSTVMQLFSNVPSQSPEAVGKCFIDILALNEVGKVWLIDDSKISKIQMTSYWPKK